MPIVRTLRKVGRTLRTPSGGGGASASYPSDLTIATAHDTVPNFARDADILSVQSGNWSSSSTWDLGRAPEAGEVVGIKTTHTVTYDLDAATAFEAVGVAGNLFFRTNADTQLWVRHLLVYGPEVLGAGNYGHLRVGTEASPVEVGVTAEVVIRNVAIDTGTVESPGVDPAQYGNGLVAWGKVQMHGQVKTPFDRVSVEPVEGHTSFTFGSAPSGWVTDDLLVIPDTRQLNNSERFSSYTPQWETRTISSLSGGNTVANFASGLDNDHFGGEHGYGANATTPADYYPHVANLSRNVVIRSEDGTGVRGHTFFTDRADVDIRYCEFRELGRTTNGTLDSTTFDGGGNPTHIGTNQIGRYAVHWHHLYGPYPVVTGDYQYRFVGNAIHDPLPAPPSASLPASKWGIAIHDSHYGLIQSNVVHHYAGAGIFTEDGSESCNVIDGNFCCNIIGDITQRNTDGRSGAGFAFQGFNNYVRNNVSAGNAGTAVEIVSGSGYYYSTDTTGGGGSTRQPLYRGADVDDGTEGVEYELVHRRLVPILEFQNNEAYGAIATGMTIWWLGSEGYAAQATATSTILGLKVWHAWEEAWFGYPCDRLTIDGLVFRGDPALTGAGSGAIGLLWGDYWSSDILVTIADVRGCDYGVAGNLNIHGTFFTVSDSYFQCLLACLSIETPSTPGTGTTLEDHTSTYDNCALDQYGANPSFLKMEMKYTTARAKTNLRILDRVNVTDFDGVPGDDFRLYYEEQAPDYEMPVSVGDPTFLTACPEAGLTNAQAYVKYHADGTLKVPAGTLGDAEGCAVAGAVAPDDATTRAGILGLLDES